MIIGINGNEANIKHRVGVGQYAYELLRHFTGAKLRVYLSSPPLPDMPPLDYKVLPGKGLWTLTTLQKELLREKDLDVFFTPSHYAPLYLPIPSVISIMDMSFERFPAYFTKKDYFQLKYWTKLSASLAKKILTISEFSKKEILEIYKFPEKKAVVTYPGYDATRFNTKVKRKKGNYFLFLGTLQPRKNLLRLIDAFGQLGRKDIKLVIAGMINEGRGGWMHEPIFAKVKALGLDKNIIFTGYVPEAGVPALFAGSLAFVLPSLYEGFGIPAIEAMATGVPVVVSRVSSLPEICGPVPVYIDEPDSTDSIRQALEQILTLSEAERREKISLGLNWIKRYNWNDTAKKTLEVLYEAAQR